MTAKHSDARFRENYRAEITLGRRASPVQAATQVCFLLCEGSSYATGQVLSVNGGFTIAM